MAERFMPAPGARIEYVDTPQPTGGRFMPAPGARIEYVDDDAAPEVGKGESFLRGAAQGITLGFADELTGLAEAAVSGKTYAQARDEARAAYRAAQEANPITYGAGQIGGGVATALVPGAGALGLAKLGTGFGAAAARGALAGGISGLGEAEAAKPGAIASAAELGTAAAGGAALGGAVGGVLGTAAQRLVGGAAERDATRVIDQLTLGATAKMRDRVAGKAGEAIDRTYALAKETPELVQAARRGDTTAALERVTSRLDELGRAKDDIYNAVAAVDKGIPVGDVVKVVDKLRAELAKSPDTLPISKLMASKADDIMEAWGDRQTVALSELRQYVSGIGRTAFAGNPGVDPTKAAAAGRDLYGRLLGALDDHFEGVAKSNPKLGLDIGKLRETNKKISTLINVQDALQYKATREATAPTTLRSRVGQAADIAAMAASLGSASPVPWAAVKGARYAVPYVARTADAALAGLVESARAGNVTSQAIQTAIEAGVPRGTVEAVLTRLRRREPTEPQL